MNPALRNLGYWLFVALCVSPRLLRADVRVTLPLHGYFHPSRFMPVHVTANGQDAVEFHDGGVIPLTVGGNGEIIDETVPMLPINDRARTLRDLNLHPLADEELLIGLVGIDPAAAAAVMHQSVTTASLDLTNPLPGPPFAWQTLDGLLLDDAAAQRINEGQLRALLAAGTTIGVRSDRKPAGNWPWQRDGAFWVVRPQRFGPTSIIESDAYTPTYAWTRGWPAAFRRQAVLSALLVTALLLAAALWRSRYAFAAVAIVAVAGTTILCIALSRQPPTVRLDGTVEIRGDALVQRDAWTWVSTLRGGNVDFPADGLTRPIFFSRAQIEQSGLEMAWRNGLNFHFHLPPRGVMTFVTQSSGADVPQQPLGPANSSLTLLLQSVYGGQNLTVAGQYDDVLVLQPATTPR
jgi:hypothetical protein